MLSKTFIFSLRLCLYENMLVCGGRYKFQYCHGFNDIRKVIHKLDICDMRVIWFATHQKNVYDADNDVALMKFKDQSCHSFPIISIV